MKDTIVGSGSVTVPIENTIFLDIETFSEENSPKCFDPRYGKIISIAYAIDSEEPECLLCEQPTREKEREIVQKFWKKIRKLNNPVLVGHNLILFDLFWLISKSRKYRLKIPNFSVFDTINLKYKSNGNYFNLNDLADEYGLNIQKNGSGNEVAGLYKNLLFDSLRAYNIQDVEVVRKIYFKACDLGGC
ncbi:MAG: ribonuclease H-like domain-containing protein [Candidatus Aenigmatarchaeota archaeon]